jgi:uncharacterized membrane protein YcaP (DUF421 family)
MERVFYMMGIEVKDHFFRNFFYHDYLKTFLQEDLTDAVMQIFTLIVILVVGMIALKVVGKKSLSQLTLPQSLFLLMYASTLGTLIVQPQHLIIAVIITIAIVITVNTIERLALKFPNFESYIVGIPDVLYKNDEFVRAELHQNKISADQVEVMCRLKGIPSLEVVERVILEPNGQPSVQVKPQYEQVKKIEFDHAMNQIMELLGEKYKPLQMPEMANLYVEADKRKNVKDNAKLE